MCQITATTRQAFTHRIVDRSITCRLGHTSQNRQTKTRHLRANAASRLEQDKVPKESVVKSAPAQLPTEATDFHAASSIGKTCEGMLLTLHMSTTSFCSTQFYELSVCTQVHFMVSTFLQTTVSSLVTSTHTISIASTTFFIVGCAVKLAKDNRCHDQYF